jgi:predicted glycosyltransferase
MRIWIDLATGPQVLFYRPIVSELQKRGNNVLITTREFTETVSLADRYQLVHTVVGAHGGATMIGKSMAHVRRAAELARLVRHYGATLAVGTSYTQALVAPLLHIPLVVCGDYEGNPGNHLSLRVAKRIIVPNVFHKPNLLRYGASLVKIVSYGGIKENVYLADFVPDPRFLEMTGIPADRIIATMRPPSDVSSYHRFKNPLFDELLLWASNHPNTVIVLLPRGREQRLRYEEMHLTNVLIPKEVLDGPNLVYYSDLVIGAGGTMNREATVLGTPVYTIFKGRLGSVDQNLIKSGKMVRIEDASGFSKIDYCKKKYLSYDSWSQGKGLVNEVVDKILEVCT